MERINVKLEKTQEGKTFDLPKYQTELSAGVDLHACIDQDITLEPGEIVLIPTGIKLAIPTGYEAQIRPRSGLAYRHGISLVNTPGTIDADYRGEIKIIMINHGKEAFTFSRGERIAQMVFNPIVQADFHLTESLDESERGEGGFGHTGS